MMEGIPILSIGNTASAILSTILLIVIWRRYRAAHREDPLLKDLLAMFVFLTLYFCIVALPGLYTKHVQFISITPRIGIILIFLADAYFVSIPLQILGWRSATRVMLIIFAMLAAILVSFDFWYFGLSHVRTTGPFYYYEPNQLPIIRILEGAISMAGTLAGSIFFLMRGAAIDDPSRRRTRIRSLLLGWGFLTLALAGILNYVIFPLSYNAFILIGSSILALAGIILVGGGVLVHPNKSTGEAAS